jgi:DNA-binding FrmR family transcriptional regulator
MCCTEVPNGRSKVKAAKSVKGATHAASGHPDHSDQIKKLNRVVGQIQGVQRMIEERRYCPDILVQTRAAASAIRSIEQTILEKHLKNCVTEALSESNPSKANAKIEELLDLFGRF